MGSTHGNYAIKVITLKASGAQTASTNGAALGTSLITAAITEDNVGFTQAGRAYLDITATAGTSQTMDLKIQGRVSGSDAWTDLGSFTRKAGSSTTLTSPATDELFLPGPLPPELRYVSTLGGTSPSFTYSLKVVIGG